MGKVDYTFLENCLQKNFSFAAYTLPGESSFQFIAQKGNATEIKTLSEIKNGFVIHPFDSKQNSILLIKDDFFFAEGDVIKNIGPEYNSTSIEVSTDYKSAPIKSTSKEEYFKIFGTFKKALDSGEYKKLVLSRVKKITAKESFNIIDFYEKLNKNYPQSFNHISYTPQSGIWLGASPEILLEIKNNTAKTVALAGTQKKSSNYNWDSKEIEEQKFVVDFIEEILKKQGSSITKTNETVEAGNVAHLKTKFTFPADEIKHIPELISKLHPTPAVCGLPKIKAISFVRQNETHRRGYYTGFLGPYDHKKETHLFVNLRCLHFDGKHLYVFVGGGLTKDSVAEKEWHETELKAMTLESIL